MGNRKRTAWSKSRPVAMPVESWGQCDRQTCFFVGVLADGLCDEHYGGNDKK